MSSSTSEIKNFADITMSANRDKNDFGVNASPLLEYAIKNLEDCSRNDNKLPECESSD